MGRAREVSASVLLLVLAFAAFGAPDNVGAYGHDGPVGGDVANTFTVVDIVKSPTCDMTVSGDSQGHPRRIYQNGFCYNTYEDGPSAQQYSFKFSSQDVTLYEDLNCDDAKVIVKDPTTTGTCLLERTGSEYYLYFNTTSLFSNTYVMSEDIAANRCDLPGSSLKTNDFYDLRSYGKCYTYDGYSKSHPAVLGYTKYVVNKIFAAGCEEGNSYEVTSVLPFDTCVSVTPDAPTADAYINVHGRSGALDHFMGLRKDTNAHHFPFYNTTAPPWTPKPEPQDKDWVKVKVYNDNACSDDENNEYEYILQVGRCYRYPGSNISQLMTGDEVGDMAYFIFMNSSTCEDAGPAYQLPIGADLHLGCSKLWERHAIQKVVANTVDTSKYGVVILRWTTSNSCDTSDPNGFLYQFYPLDTCLGAEEGPQMWQRTGPNKVTRTGFNKDQPCNQASQAWTHELPFRTCLPSEGDQSSEMILDPETAAHDLLAMFPGSSSGDFPLFSPPVAAKTWSTYRLFTDPHCFGPAAGGDPLLVAENGLCYDDDDSDGSAMFTSTELKLYSGKQCQPQAQSGTQTIGPGSCIQDPTPGSPYYWQFQSTTVIPNSLNVTSDVVVSKGCKFDYSAIGYVARDYTDCSPWDGGSRWYPVTIDGQDMIMEKQFENSGNCTGSYAMHGMQPNACFPRHNQEEPGNYYTANPTSGALTGLVQEFDMPLNAFPFMNQTLPPFAPSPANMTEKRWLWIKGFRKDGCGDENTQDFERLVELGVCYFVDGESKMVFYDNATHNELYLYGWEGPGCFESGTLSYRVPISMDLGLDCSPVFEGRAKARVVEPESFDADYGAIGLFFFGPDCKLEDQALEYRMFPFDACLSSPDNEDPSELESIALSTNATGVNVKEYGGNFCPTFNVTAEQFFPFRQCVNQEDGSSIMAISAKDPSSEMVTIFGGTPRDYPFEPISNKTWSVVAYTGPDDTCAQNAPGTIYRVFEENKCFDNFHPDTNQQQSQIITGTEIFLFTGFGCEHAKQFDARTVDDNSCFKDAFYYEYGWARVARTNVPAQGLNVTADVVGAHYCKYDSGAQVSFVMMNYYECMNGADVDNEMLFPAIGYDDDEAKSVRYLGSKKFDIDNCTGNYTREQLPMDACINPWDDNQPHHYMIVTGRNGALDTLMKAFGEEHHPELFPFANQTHEPHIPFPEPGPNKKWVHVKEYADELCNGENTADYEQLWEMEVCYEEGNMSVALVVDDGEPFYVVWASPGCNGTDVSEMAAFGNDLDLSCSPLGNIKLDEVEPAQFHAETYDLVYLHFDEYNCSFANGPPKYKFAPSSTCLSGEDYSYIVTTNSSGMYLNVYEDATCSKKYENFPAPVAYPFKQCVNVAADGSSTMALNSKTAGSDMLAMFGGAETDYPLVALPPEDESKKVKVLFSLRFEGVDYAALKADGKLGAIEEDLKTSWSRVAGVPRERVLVILMQGSLITNVQIEYEGQGSEAQAEKTKTDVKDLTMVVDVIKDSDAFSNALGIADKDNVDLDQIKQFTTLNGDVQVEQEDAKKASLPPIGLLAGIGGGALVVLTLGMYGYKKRKNSGHVARNKFYSDLNGFGSPTARASMNHFSYDTPEPKRQTQFNPLSDQL
ncbi:hypothetical protein HOP50_05g39590 [Chloropicon primus]|nr:hypothetical protein HOP50_05g39590 [Chloropicon primus]